jgi:hypothetical protein
MRITDRFVFAANVLPHNEPHRLIPAPGSTDNAFALHGSSTARTTAAASWRRNDSTCNVSRSCS